MKSKLRNNFFRSIACRAVLAAAALLASAGLTACSNEDDNNGIEYPAELLGNWSASYQTITTKIDGLEDQKEIEEHPQHLLQIKSDGVITSQLRDPSNGSWRVEYRGAWSYFNDYLFVAPDEDTRLIYYIQNVNNDYMVLVWSEETTVGGDEEEGIPPTPCTKIYATQYSRTAD